MALPRLFISTDMQMITGINNIDGDKDDVQSLVHALMYQDKFDIVGIASSVSRWQPGKNDASFIHHVIDKYGANQDELARHGSGFKTAAELHDITYQGTKTVAGSSGIVAQTEASRAIVREAREAAAAGTDLYVATWGGVGDVARALHDAPDIADNIRLLSVAGQVQEPNAHKYLKANFAGKGDLWWIDEASTHFGVYAMPDNRYPTGNSWAANNAKGHGALGDLFYQNTIDIRGTSGDLNLTKMGDSATILYLIDTAGNNDDPTAESWGGEYRKAGSQYWVDRTDQGFNFAESGGARTVYEDRAAWQGDFAKRFDWLTSSPSAPAPTPVPGPGQPGIVGSGSDALVLKISQDAWNGSAQYTVKVDGKQIGGVLTASASHAAGQDDVITIKGDWSAGNHNVTVTFLNDAWGGSAGADRNLHVDGVSYNGKALAQGTAFLNKNGAADFTFTDTGGAASGGMVKTIGSGSDALVLKISQDAWNGSAQYTVRVDGKQIGGTLTASASHASGQDDVITVRGDWNAGSHKVTVTFLNDAYGGVAGTDRNLHVDGISYNGTDLARDTALLNRNGAADFAFTDTGSAAMADQLFA
ncbi:nucleoside hydrolase-like domain-containing protein [Belnapia sp. F-4-1]|uniref:nucleoside hydrolase-like domain-containing protein n=1 Tax=Belnapia sp. F-4-1 TaxID=1545443 RepID=UPI00068CCC4B|nr:nucleoside hydrolase-like domain-containing protein [Belnapia sp. F-4-1]